ncbi:13640_t:CDS:2 [Ambispora leptoticha]|uniref:E2 ubiquitin-conjugating enzyme n=1 Tax=Ambispora leptoticha TaxID=144679 RepID=A0A9N8WGD0_9GLOM|nr:13640_t:CDS:2 [Ambispora leptoticha]
MNKKELYKKLEGMPTAQQQNISPAVIKRISKELHDIIEDPPEGIRTIINYEDICDIQAWILGPECTPYEKGCFKVKLMLNADFPAVPPKCYFITKIFHPNVSRNGEVCVNTLKKDWQKDLGVKHILLTVKCLLIVPNAESALNEEAGKLLLENYDDYAKHARLLTGIHASTIAPVFLAPPNPSSSSSSDTASSTNATNTNATTITSMTATTTVTTATAVSSTTPTPSTSSNPKKTADDSKELEVTKPEDVSTHTQVSPLADSHHINETKSNLKKNPTSSSSNPNSNSTSPTVTPKKRVAEKKLDKKQADKKRSLKRL